MKSVRVTQTEIYDRFCAAFAHRFREHFSPKRVFFERQTIEIVFLVQQPKQRAAELMHGAFIMLARRARQTARPGAKNLSTPRLFPKACHPESETEKRRSFAAIVQTNSSAHRRRSKTHKQTQDNTAILSSS